MKEKNTKEINEIKFKKKKKGIGKKILLIIIFILLAIGVIFGYKVYKNGGGTKGLLMTAIGHDKDTVLSLDKMYCLILGKSQNLTDTLILASYDPKDQSAAMLSIPRDTFIGDYKSSATAWDKINSVYQTENGPQKVMKYVSNLTGIDVKYYLMVDTEALKVLVDEIDGVTFNVPIDMNYDDSSQDLHIHLEAGEQLLDGDKAEQVVRFRHNNNGSTYPSEYGQEDIGRMKTQRAFLTALAKKMLSWKSVTKINGILDIAQKYVETNLDFNAIKDYIPYAVEFNTENLLTETLPGTNTNKNKSGTWIFVHDKVKTQALVQELFYDRDKTEEELNEENNQTNRQNTTNTSDTTKNKTYITNKAEVKVEVLNGSGVSKNLQTVVDDLEGAGYKVTRTGSTSATSKTTITNKKNVSDTLLKNMKEVLEVGTIQYNQSSSSKVDVTIIIGKDYK